MTTLKTFIRFAIILVFLILLIALSVALFKLIPKGINQLATASLSLTGLNEATTTQNIVDNRVAQPVATTTGGLNGIITSPNNTSTGSITVLESTPKPITRTVTRTVYYPISNQSGFRNIKVSLISTGIIDRHSGQFVNTNSFNTSDVISVRYKIENTGNTNISSFNMKVDMPAYNYNDRTRYLSLDLPAYSAYQVEARFDGIDTSISPVVKIYADIDNLISESDESDNTLSVTLNNINYNNNYNYNYNYNNNCYYSNGYYYNCGSNYNNNNCYYSNGYLTCNDNNYYYNSANIQIVSIEPGKMVNNEFSSQTNLVYGDRPAIKIRVRNNGGNFSQSWSTRATFSDTTGSNRYVTVDNERGMNSGEERVIIIQTNSTLNRGTTIFNVNVDSNNTVYETNESDNNANVTVYTY